MSRICSICNEPIIPVQDHPTGWRHSDAADVSIFGNKPCCGWAKPKSEQPTQLPKWPHTLDVERAENWLATNHPYFSSSRQLAEVLHDYSLATCQDAKIAELEIQLEDQRQLVSELDDMREQRNQLKVELNLAWDAATEYKAERASLTKG